MGKDKDPLITIIIPAYNEEKRIKRTLMSHIDHFSKEYPGQFELVVVTDGCTDRTKAIIKKLGKKEVRHFDFKHRLGKGGAIARGCQKARGEIVTYTDADGSTTPRQLDDLISILMILECDGIAASRYVGGSKLLVKQTMMRRVASRVFNLIVRTMFGLPFRDTQCGAKVFTKKVAKDIFSQLRVTDWAFDINLLYNAQKAGYDIREIPIVWADSQDSKFNMMKVAPIMFLSVVRLRIYESPLRFMVTNEPAKRFAWKVRWK